MDFSDCETIKQKCGSLNKPSSDEAPSFVAQKLNKTFEDFDMNTPVPYSDSTYKAKEMPTFLFGNSQQLNKEQIYLVQNSQNQMKIIVEAEEFMKTQGESNLLGSLGANYETHMSPEGKQYLEFTCSIDAIDLITGNDVLFQGIA